MPKGKDYRKSMNLALMDIAVEEFTFYKYSCQFCVSLSGSPFGGG